MTPETLLRATEAMRDLPWERTRSTRTLAAVLPGLMVACGARTAVEIGIWNGFATAVLARILAAIAPGDGLLISCDINPDYCKQGRAATADLGDSIRHEVIASDSRLVNWPAELAKNDRDEIDIAFIDGCHDYEVVADDIYHLAPLVRPGGFLICHDYTPKYPGVWQAVNEFALGSHIFVIPYDAESGSLPCAILQRSV